MIETLKPILIVLLQLCGIVASGGALLFLVLYVIASIGSMLYLKIEYIRSRRR